MAHRHTHRAAPLALAPALALTLVATSFAPSLAAQGDYPFKKVTAATFGQNLTLSLSGMPKNRLMLFMLSLNAGPTPLVSLIGQDPRSLEVGIDLAPLWLFLNSGSGAFNLTFPTPNSKALQGTLIHLQTMVAGTPAQIVDKISNKIAIMPGASGTSGLLGAKLAASRALSNTFPIGAASTSASGSDFMMAGGAQGTLLSRTGLTSTEIYDFDRMSIKAGPKLTTNRALCTATVLSDGRVLLVGGVDNKGVPIATAEIYDPKQNKFVAAASMASKRAGHGATLLPDGRVMVSGGAAFFPDSQFSNILQFASTGVLNSTEIYDPKNNKWSAGSNIREQLLGPALTTLGTGKVLLSGGIGIDKFFGLPVGLVTRANCNLYDPTKNTWAGATAMKTGRTGHDINVVVLKNGKVLVTGGVSGSVTVSNTSLSNVASIANAELYDPSQNTWTALANMAAGRTAHTATLMSNGNVIIAGGTSGPVLTTKSTNSVQEFNATSNTWKALNALKVARAGHGAALTADGLLVLFGGVGGINNLTLDTIESIHQ